MLVLFLPQLSSYIPIGQAPTTKFYGHKLFLYTILAMYALTTTNSAIVVHEILF